MDLRRAPVLFIENSPKSLIGRRSDAKNAIGIEGTDRFSRTIRDIRGNSRAQVDSATWKSEAVVSGLSLSRDYFRTCERSDFDGTNFFPRRSFVSRKPNIRIYGRRDSSDVKLVYRRHFGENFRPVRLLNVLWNSTVSARPVAHRAVLARGIVILACSWRYVGVVSAPFERPRSAWGAPEVLSAESSSFTSKCALTSNEQHFIPRISPSSERRELSRVLAICLRLTFAKVSFVLTHELSSVFAILKINYFPPRLRFFVSFY